MYREENTSCAFRVRLGILGIECFFDLEWITIPLSAIGSEHRNLLNILHFTSSKKVPQISHWWEDSLSSPTSSHGPLTRIFAALREFFRRSILFEEILLVLLEFFRFSWFFNLLICFFCFWRAFGNGSEHAHCSYDQSNTKIGSSGKHLTLRASFTKVKISLQFTFPDFFISPDVIFEKF